MRWIVVMVALGLAGCTGTAQHARTSGPPVWQSAEGRAATLSELRQVALVCPHQTTAPIYSPEILGFPSAQALTQFNQHLMDAPSYGDVSAAEFSACMHAAGYSRVALRPAGHAPPPR